MQDSNGHVALEDPRVGIAGPARDEALEIIRCLADEIGARRPCSAEEERAAAMLVFWLTERGVDARTEQFSGYASFGQPYALMLAGSFAGGLLQLSRSGRARQAGGALAAASALIAAAESDLRWTPVSRALSTAPSLNVVAHVPSAGPTRRRVCLVAHLDTTRSGAIFHPALAKHLGKLLQIPAVSAVLAATRPVIRRIPGGSGVHAAALGGLAFSLAMLAERELRGEDVPGASDNGSGCAVVAQLAAECAAAPLEHTELDVLITGGEEAGMLGAQAYARRHRLRCAETTFLNFDTVGGEVPLTYILREGGVALNRPASASLVKLLEQIARRRPDLGLRPARTTPGLPTDATPMRARGWEAVTLLAQGDTIPNYHLPTDTFANIAPESVGRALETGRELLAALDDQVRRR